MNAKTRIFMELQTLLKNYSAHFRPTPICPEAAMARPRFSIHRNACHGGQQDTETGFVHGKASTSGQPQSKHGFVHRQRHFRGQRTSQRAQRPRISGFWWTKPCRDMVCPLKPVLSWTYSTAKQSCPRERAFWWTSETNTDKIMCLCVTFASKLL